MSIVRVTGGTELNTAEKSAMVYWSTGSLGSFLSGGCSHGLGPCWGVDSWLIGDWLYARRAIADSNGWDDDASSWSTRQRGARRTSPPRLSSSYKSRELTHVDKYKQQSSEQSSEQASEFVNSLYMTIII